MSLVAVSITLSEDNTLQVNYLPSGYDPEVATHRIVAKLVKILDDTQ